MCSFKPVHSSGLELALWWPLLPLESPKVTPGTSGVLVCIPALQLQAAQEWLLSHHEEGDIKAIFVA